MRQVLARQVTAGELSAIGRRSARHRQQRRDDVDVTGDGFGSLSTLDVRVRHQGQVRAAVERLADQLGYDGALVDFEGANAFEDVEGCAVTLPRDGTCPEPLPSCE